MRNLFRKLSARKGKAASGQVVIEVIASIIMFTIMLALIMSISVYLYFQQALVTAAREGCRQASLNANMGAKATESTGMGTVKSFVQTEIQKLTGQAFSSSTATITVVPPSQSASQVYGQRDVKVNITWKMKNPIGISKMLNALGATGTEFETIPVYASATMRYEE